jgi:transcriptional regulator with XRE-family HTH domain
MNEKLRQKRLSANLTHRELSALTGLDIATIVDAEHGHHRPRPRTRVLLMEALEVEVEAELFPISPSHRDTVV